MQSPRDTAETPDLTAFEAVEAGGCAPPVLVSPAPPPAVIVERAGPPAGDRVALPGLAAFLFERRIRPAAAAKAFGVSRAAVDYWLRPFGDRERRVPRDDAMARIAAFTGWTLEETRASFTPPSTGAEA